MDTTPAALSDILVIDLSRILAGPYCTMMLADFGAEVIKIEQPHSGDGTRQWGPPWVGDQSAYFLSANRNKKSLTLNLKTADGRSLLRQLIEQADVVVENFKPGTMERFGLSYEMLAADNPGLIYCAITGYGQTGPLRDRPGYDFMIQAQGGLMSITGPAEGEPHKAGVAIVDVTTGLFAHSAILAALHHRQRTGEGQYIDVALFDAQLAWLINVAHNYFATGETPDRYGNAHPNIVPYETFPTADGFIALAVGSDAQYQRLCQVGQRPDLWQDGRFQTNNGRVQHRHKLIPQLQDMFRSRTTAAWETVLAEANIPASAINDVPTALAQPQAAARHMVQTIEHATTGPIQVLGPVAKLSHTPARVRAAPPTLGADTAVILQQRLGLTAKEIDALYEKGVL